MNETAFLKEANILLPYLTETRRDFHRHPELGAHEIRTSQRIRQELEAMGLEVSNPVGTAIIGLLRGGAPGKTVALRADMDALPIIERTGLPFASENDGVMHACGHDFHITAALGAAKLLSAHRGELSGNVKFLFQPNEEGTGGAERMVKAGCMESPHVDAVFGGHVDPNLPAGAVGIRYGCAYAASNPFHITLTGASTHGAQPDAGRDPIVCAAQIISAAQTLVSRRTAPADSAVVTFGSIHAGTAGNIVPVTATMTGIIRTLGPEMRSRITGEFRALVSGIAAAMGIDADVNIETSYPGVVNSDAQTDLIRGTAEALLGKEHVVLTPHPFMGTEDFGYFIDASAGSFVQIGVSDSDQPIAPLHSDLFAPDERALPVAAALYAAVIQNYLQEGGSGAPFAPTAP